MPNQPPEGVGRRWTRCKSVNPKEGQDFPELTWDAMRPPSQSHAGVGPIALWTAVVHRAVEDSEGQASFLQTYKREDVIRQKRQLRNESARWLLSPHTHVGSFRWICVLTGADWTAAVEFHTRRLTELWGAEFLRSLRRS